VVRGKNCGEGMHRTVREFWGEKVNEHKPSLVHTCVRRKRASRHREKKAGTSAKQLYVDDRNLRTGGCGLPKQPSIQKRGKKCGRN